MREERAGIAGTEELEELLDRKPKINDEGATGVGQVAQCIAIAAGEHQGLSLIHTTSWHTFVTGAAREFHVTEAATYACHV